MLVALVLAACSSNSRCPEPTPNDRTTGTVTQGASTANMGWTRFDQTPTQGRCFSIGTDSSWLVFHADCPKGPGSYSLEDLHAAVCDESACANVHGTLSVSAIDRPCGADACGRLNAEVDLPTNDNGASGHVSVQYSETASDTCGSQTQMFGL